MIYLKKESYCENCAELHTQVSEKSGNMISNEKEE